MNALERRIKELREETERMMLLGAAADFAAYSSLVARYKVLAQLEDFIADRKRTEDPTETIDDNE